jgi:hypothetical protein
MATTKLLYDTLRFTVIRCTDGSIKITPKDDPTKAVVLHTLESDLVGAYHRQGFAGVDRFCERLLAEMQRDSEFRHPR